MMQRSYHVDILPCLETVKPEYEWVQHGCFRMTDLDTDEVIAESADFEEFEADLKRIYPERDYSWLAPSNWLEGYGK